VVLPGVVIEEGVSVGSLSLVNKSLPGWKIYAGIPAKPIKDRKKDLLKLEEEFLKELQQP
jgi:acetyltransferase-like isoleucine patch superfamily enzyme